MAFSFRTIDLNTDLSTCIQFRKDSFRVSFNGRDNGLDEDEYIDLLKKRTVQFPWGYVMVEDIGQVVGQMEFFIRKYEGRRIGFVSLYYLISDARGQGQGAQLTNYAEARFRQHGVSEYHLRVSPTNEHAVRFYEKAGLAKLKEESFNHVVWRMGKTLR
ncbi:GNAT family N-acetyltransferase [Alicyclobacillus sp. SO9]|uniref:GNAT family N-acetyltransferase n=1 Tax=Alicyclobacillus sp. SO9 TaxID=2665646 RepID=UPI0018E805C6|nr:GNAT family N-acetyltransferase [Alicyclobacillus sp. SO9]QQE77844.1 GNAT family N-acetyltransferase [Alicyclobacillus sp. SO9]